MKSPTCDVAVSMMKIVAHSAFRRWVRKLVEGVAMGADYLEHLEAKRENASQE